MTISAVCASTVRFSTYLSTGKERDTESGNDYFGARYYASTMGRFMSPDWSAKVMPVPYAKLNDPQSLNLYAYVMNNPMTRFDADGHKCEDNGTCWIDKINTNARQAMAAAESTMTGAFNSGWSALVKAATPASKTNASAPAPTPTATPKSEPNQAVAVGADALALAGAATGHPGLGGRVGAAISVANDPSVPNLVMTGMSFVPVVGEAVGAVTAVQDVGLLAGHWITDNVMAPMLNAAPPQMINDGNGLSIPNPALMSESELIN
jgi:RHS repeat-associated protein